MEKYNASLNRDRAFDVGNLQELLAQGKKLITQAIDTSREMEDAISRIQETYGTIDAEYKVSGLGAEIGRLLSEGLVKECYQEAIEYMEKILTKLMTDMPEYDSAIAKDMEELREITAAISSHVADLRALLDGGVMELSYQEFWKRLDGLQAGWTQSAQDLMNAARELEEDMYGVKQTAVKYSYDPVNLSTGNFVYDHEDLKMGGEIPLSFHRYYNALDSVRRSMGRSFRHNYEMELSVKEEGTKITICMQDGQRKTFKKTPDGIYLGCRSAIEVLTEENPAWGYLRDGGACGQTEGQEENITGYCMAMQDGTRYHFDPSGRLARKENRHGLGITFTYNEQGKLERAENGHGEYLLYAYNEEGLLAEVQDHTGRKVELSYEKKRLAAVKTPLGGSYRYAYGQNGRITETVNPRGITAVVNEYDDKRRITRQIFPDGGCMEYAYDDDKRHVTLTERNGSRTTYVHDSRYRCTDILYEDGTKEHFGYNEKNLRVLYVDRNGNTTRYAYDNRGNLTQAINALGQKINMTYDTNNHLVNLKVNGKEQLRNSYDTEGNLISSVGADGNGNIMSYDEKGRPVRIETADGSTTELFYDERGNIEKIQDANGITVRYQYDSLNRVVCTIDGNGNATTYEYNQTDKIRRVTNPLGDSRSYSYNESGKVTRVTDYDGYVVEADYNELGKISRITDKEGNATNYTYDLMWNTSQVVQADGGTISYRYDGNNRLTEETLPEGGSLTYTYDGNGNRTSETDAEGNETAYAYDALNRLIKMTDAAGAETCYDYDEEGNLACITDALGNKTVYTYDERKQCTAQTDALGNTIRYTYDAMGNVTAILQPNGCIENREYANGRLTKIKKANGSTICYTYDGNGNCISMENGAGEKRIIAYDALNRRTAVTNPEGGILRYEYDAVGNVTKMTDENGRETAYAYTPNGNLAMVTDALGNQTRYSYDAMGRLIRVERNAEAQNENTSGKETVQTTAYEWNQRGLVTSITDALGAVETFGYDRNGKMTDRWDRDGCHTTYAYDNRGLVTDILYADGSSVAYSYDALRRLEEVKDSAGTTQIVTDALGRVISVTDAQGKSVGYEWGSVNERLRLIYPDGKQAAYHYNEKGQLAELATAKGIINYAYDEMGRLKKKTFPGGTITSYSYNAAGRLTQMRHEGEGFEEEYSYQYDLAGNKIQARKLRQEMDEDNGSFDYAYDALNRLTEVARDGNLLRKYTYDAFGNRILKEDYSSGERVQTQYQYNANNQMTAQISDEEELAYTYDHRGNLTAVSRGEELLKMFSFDAANRMSSALEIKDGMEKRVQYSYNAFGNRTGQDIYSRKAESAIPKTAVQEPQDPQQRIRYTLDLTRQYHNLLVSEEEREQREQVFYWDGNVAAMEETGQNSYYLQDDLGSPMQLVDEGGEIRETYGFDEFGSPMSSKDPNLTCQESTIMSQVQPFGYTGYQMEAAGGLYYAQARRYDAGAGRFVSEDKIAGFTEMPYTLNRYGYCWNQPLEHVDLNGKIVWPILALIGVCVAIGLTGCGTKPPQEENSISYPMPEPSDHEYHYKADTYNSDEYIMRTNCYAYALDIVDNPVVGGPLYTRMESYLSDFELTFAAQPGLFSDQYNPYDNSILSGTDAGNQRLVELVKDDAKAMGLNFQEYEEGMSGGYAVLLVVKPGADYHWYRQEADGTWSHKIGDGLATTGVVNPIRNAMDLKYTTIVGYYYITEACDVN